MAATVPPLAYIRRRWVAYMTRPWVAYIGRLLTAPGPRGRRADCDAGNQLAANAIARAGIRRISSQAIRRAMVRAGQPV